VRTDGALDHSGNADDRQPENENTNGDFSPVWLAYYPKISLFVRPYFRVVADREDAVQEILWRVYSSGKWSGGAASSASWIYRVARNYCIDCLRKRARRERLDVLWRGGEEWRRPVAEPERELLAREAGEALRAAVESLDPADQQLCFLYHFEDMSVRDLHRALGLPVGTVKSRLHSIRKKLKSILEPVYER
jgi:RNA polymerase sigma-70 factor (ECF subfamily)